MKQKDAAPFDPIRLRLAARLDSAVVASLDAAGVAAELSASEQQVIGATRELFSPDGAAGSKIFDVGKLPKSTFYRALTALVRKSEIVNIGNQKRTHYVLRQDVVKPPELADE